jgi:hypothetical protein
MSLSSSATSAIELVRKYYDSVLLEEDVAIRRAALGEAIAATLQCSGADQLVVEKQSVEDMDETVRHYKGDFVNDYRGTDDEAKLLEEAREQIRNIRRARASFDVYLCEGRLAVVLAKKGTV